MKVNDKIIKFLSKPEVQDLLNNNKFKEMFDVYRENFNWYTYAENANSIRELLESCGIDCLKYISEIPPYFYYKSNIKEINVLGNITTIGTNAFEYSLELTQATLEEGVSVIGDDAFKSCSSLRTVNLPSTLRLVGLAAFQYCNSLEKIELPGSLKVVSYQMFNSCKSLTEAKLCEGIGKIDSYAFNSCPRLAKIELPSSLKVIEGSIFEGCENLKEVEFRGTFEQWKSVSKNNGWATGSSIKTIKCANKTLKRG